MIGCSRFGVKLTELTNNQFMLEMGRNLSGESEISRIKAAGHEIQYPCEIYRVTVDGRIDSNDYSNLSHMCWHFLSAGRMLRERWDVHEHKKLFIQQTMRSANWASRKKSEDKEKTVGKYDVWKYLIWPALVSKHGVGELATMLHGILNSYASIGRALVVKTLRSKDSRGREGNLVSSRFAFMEFSTSHHVSWSAEWDAALAHKFGEWKPVVDQVLTQEHVDEFLELIGLGSPDEEEHDPLLGTPDDLDWSDENVSKAGENSIDYDEEI